MVKRSGKFGDFMACMGYPNCKNTINIKNNGKSAYQTQVVSNKPLRKISNPSKYQQDIFEWVINGSGNAVVNACAGSGKTTTIEHCIALIKENNPELDIVYAVFNAHVRNSAVEKGLPALTTHQLGLQAITAYLGKRPEIDDKKVSKIVKNLIQQTWDNDKMFISQVCDVVDKLKNTMLEPTFENIEIICDRFAIETNGSFNRIAELSILALKESDEISSVIDFSDMLRLPVIKNMSVKQYDWFLLDESQDTNRAQLQLIIKSVKPNGRFMAVGDIYQAIYGFRGSDIHAIERIIASFKAIELPLSITYRCPKVVVELVNNIFPEIPFELAPNAKDGIIDHMSYDKMLGTVKSGDMVLCRTNAPLVKPVFSLIRQGIKAVIRGRDIGKALVNLIEKFNAVTTLELIEKLTEYERKEVSKLIKAEKNNQASSLQDKIATIIALSDNCDYVSQIVQKCEEVFSDKDEGVIFSTVHKAKGDEENNIFILNPQLMPHKMATRENEIRQELNCLYVALSRPKISLTFVGGSLVYGQRLFDENETTEEVISEETANEEIIEPITEQVTEEIEIPTILSCPF